MSIKYYAVLFFGLALLAGCTKVQDEEVLHPPSQHEIQFPSLMADIDYEVPAVPQRTKDQLELRSGVIEVEPGSDQLQDIINAAPNNARIRLLPGIHTETSTVVIGHKLTLEGSEGAFLELDALIGLYVVGANHVSLEGLTIINGDNCLIGIAFDNADHADVDGNDISGFDITLVLEQSNHTQIRNNTIVGSGNFANSVLGVTVVNGDHVIISNNDISNNVFGIWACDEDGVAANNNLHQNTIGLILCNVPAGSVPFGTGDGGSENPATDWKVNHNTANNNFWGYLVIDGSVGNNLNNNSGSGNLVTDMELAYETNFLFGFFTPTSEDNTVNIGGTGIEVIDCGVNNTVNGGTPLSGPCSI